VESPEGRRIILCINDTVRLRADLEPKAGCATFKTPSLNYDKAFVSDYPQ
jgi:hypothetical protein